MELTTYIDRMNRTLGHQQLAALNLFEGPVLAGSKAAEVSLDMASQWHAFAKDFLPDDVVAAAEAEIAPVETPKPIAAKPEKPAVVKVTPAGGKVVSLAAAPPVASVKAEKIKAEPTKPTVAPEPVAAEKPASRNTDLTSINGIGPKVAVVLAELGVTSVEDIAAWSKADVDRIDAQLGNFQGRAKRGNWVVKAKALIEEQTTGDAAAK